jgi:3-deoxy-D-manno-octulosonate 8-phosphate phosphatase KdsC-like HAD superfamily phosphatase
MSIAKLCMGIKEKQAKCCQLVNAKIIHYIPAKREGDDLCTMDKLHSHCAKLENADAKSWVLYNSIYMKCPEKADLQRQ